MHESRNGKRNSPWAQRLDFGWVILGNVCLDGAHEPKDVSAYKTHILHNGRPSILEPYPNTIHVKRQPTSNEGFTLRMSTGTEKFEQERFDDGLGNGVFTRTKEDGKPGPSVEDRKFVAMMERNMVKNDDGNWLAPLPFREKVTAYQTVETKHLNI